MFSLLRRSLVAEKLCYSLSVLRNVSKPEGLKVPEPLRRGKIHHSKFGKFKMQFRTSMTEEDMKNRWIPCILGALVVMNNAVSENEEADGDEQGSSMTEEEIEKCRKICILTAVKMATKTSQLLVEFVRMTSNVSSVDKKYEIVHSLEGSIHKKFSTIIRTTLRSSRQMKKRSETCDDWTEEMEKTWKKFILGFAYLESLLSSPGQLSIFGLSFMEHLVDKCMKNLEDIQQHMDELKKAETIQERSETRLE